MKLIKPILFGVVSGAAVFSTTYIISNKICGSKKLDVSDLGKIHERLNTADERFDKINHAFDTLSNAFEEHVSDSLEDDSLDEVYKTIQNNFNILNDSISDSHNDLVNLFSQEIKTTIDKLNETITDKTDTLDNKIASFSTEVEKLSDKFISVENSQGEIRAEIDSFMDEYKTQKNKFESDIAAVVAEISNIKNDNQLTNDKLDTLSGLISNLEEDFLQIDELRQSIILLDTKINTTITYLESIANDTEDNSYDIAQLKIEIASLKEASSILADKFSVFETSFNGLSASVRDLDAKYEVLETAINTNHANTQDALIKLETSIGSLETKHDLDVTSINVALDSLNKKYGDLFISNNDLKNDVENLYDSVNQINLGLLELQQGLKALDDKFSSVPSVIIIDANKTISWNKLPTIAIPDAQNVKSISIYLDMNDNTEIISSNIIHAFYSNSGSFVGSLSHPSGTDYLMKAKFENNSLSVSGFWHRWANRFWSPINKNDRNTYSISKLIVTY